MKNPFLENWKAVGSNYGDEVWARRIIPVSSPTFLFDIMTYDVYRGWIREIRSGSEPNYSLNGDCSDIGIDKFKEIGYEYKR